MSKRNAQTWANVVSERPPPTTQEIAEAHGVMQDSIVRELSLNRRFWQGLPIYLGFYLSMIGILSIMLALLTRGGLLLRVFGMTVVNKRGERAGILRIGLRSVVTWLPVFVGIAVLVSAVRPDTAVGSLGIGAFRVISLLAAFPAIGIFLISFWRPERGLQDRLAGTYVVPR